MSENQTEKRKTRASSRFLTFFIEEEQYGLDIARVKEIIALMKVTHIPKTPAFVKGVINLRGSIIPVVDIRLKFGMSEKEESVDTAIIIYEIDKVAIGFVVDRVEDVVTIDKDHINSAPDFGASIDTTFISGVAEIEDGVIMMLDLKNLFDHNELTDIGQLEKAAATKEEVS